jgi:transcription antitermination factor NusA-like protein
MEKNLTAFIQQVMQTPANADEAVEVCSVAQDPGYLCLAAIRRRNAPLELASLIKSFPDLPKLVSEAFGAEAVTFVAWDSQKETFICNAFAPTPVKKVSIVHDLLLGIDIANVVVEYDRLSEAFGENGRRARLVAMLTRQDLEIHSEGYLSPN